jgi:hypothetical protein
MDQRGRRAREDRQTLHQSLRLASGALGANKNPLPRGERIRPDSPSPLLRRLPGARKGYSIGRGRNGRIKMSLRNRPEYVADIIDPLVYAANGTASPSEVGLVNRIPLDKPLWGMLLEVRYRVVTTGGVGNVVAEAAINFIQRVRVVGTHKRFGTRELVNLRAASLMELERKYSFGMSPPVISNLPAAGASFAASTYDVNFVIPVPFVPRGVPKLQQMLFLVRNDEWATFDLYVTFGDITSIGVSPQTTGVFTDFGSASGQPRVRVTVIRSILGEARGLIQPAIMRRQFLPLTSVLTAASLTDSPIQDLDVGFKVLSYLIKTGVATTTSTGGILSFSSLSDAVVTRPKVKLDNVVIKDAISPITARCYSLIESGWGGSAGVAPGAAAGADTGYHFMEFVEGHDMNTAFRGDMLNRSNKLQYSGDVTAAANQQGEIIEELIEGEPNLFAPASSSS